MPAALGALTAGQPVFLSVVQNFRRAGGYNVIHVARDCQTAVDRTLNAGQRHPGWAVRCVAGRDGPAATGAVTVVDAFVLTRDTPLILVSAPVPPTGGRVDVAWVGRNEHDLDEGRRRLADLDCLAFLVQVEAIGDNEYGEWAGYRQDRRNAIGVGVASVFEL
jgi:hypothetical protein